MHGVLKTKPLYLTLKVPVDKLSSRFPNCSLYKKRCLFPEPFLLSKSLIDKPSSKFPKTGAPM
jgi:hypothetical protein